MSQCTIDMSILEVMNCLYVCVAETTSAPAVTSGTFVIITRHSSFGSLHNYATKYTERSSDTFSVCCRDICVIIMFSIYMFTFQCELCQNSPM